MDVLVDTHALIWWWTADDRLTESATAAIADPSSRVMASAASAWEISTKDRIGRLGELSGLGERFGGLVADHGFTHLPVDHRAAAWAGGHPAPHRDPFDRILAAQAVLGGLAIVSADRALDDFGVQRIW